MTRAAIALGSNMEEPLVQVRLAFDELAALPSTVMVKRSSLYRTVPVGFADQPPFINAIALVDTKLTPRALLDHLLEIERSHGRVRDIPNGPRTLDLDIVLYGSSRHSEPGLAIPHPRMHERAFVLAPLLEVWPDAEIPGMGEASRIYPSMDRTGVEKLGTSFPRRREA